MRNIRLDICYDGTRYRGWQRLSNTDNTIQGKLEQALSRILSEEIEVSASGRTDAGTHAKMQTVSFHSETTMSCEEILQQLRRYLPEDIGVYSCRNASPRFHARLLVKEKTYCYRLWNSDEPCVFDRRFVHRDSRPLCVERMQEAAALFVGKHDFSAFCANSKMKKSTERYISAFSVETIGNEIRFTVTGNGFLHHMVRIMVGTLLEIGRGEREVESIHKLFGGIRADAGELLPACGLCLMEVIY